MTTWITPGEREFIERGNQLWLVEPHANGWLTTALSSAGSTVIAVSSTRARAEHLTRTFARIAWRPTRCGLHHNIPRRNDAERRRWPLLLWRCDLALAKLL